MDKPVFHPNAFLSEIRNIQQGLDSRTKILRALEGQSSTAKKLARKSKLTYRVVLHHLRLLECEKIILPEKTRRPYLWKITGMGQQRLKTT